MKYCNYNVANGGEDLRLFDGLGTGAGFFDPIRLEEAWSGIHAYGIPYRSWHQFQSFMMNASA